MKRNSEYLPLKEIFLYISSSEKTYYGGSQYWYPRKRHADSGCGPVAAANITACLSKKFPHKYKFLYPYPHLEIHQNEFISHMVEVRKYVRPEVFGLTSVKKFANNVSSFAASRGVSLTPQFHNDPSTIDDAIDYIAKALMEDLPVAILILTHSVKALSKYVWHWMTITYLYWDTLTKKPYIVVSTWGERHVIDFDLLWNHRRKKDVIKLIYFN